MPLGLSQLAMNKTMAIPNLNLNKQKLLTYLYFMAMKMCG